MTTIADLVQRVSNDLHSFTGLHEKVTHLTSPLSDTDLVMMVADANSLPLGVVEIDDELLYVTASTEGGATIAPYGRGYLGTVTSEHAQNSKVTASPKYPRSTIKDAISDTLKQVYPALFAVKTTTFTSAVATTYDLPADAEDVFSVHYKDIGPSGYWQPVLAFDFDRFGADRTIDIGYMPVGREVRITYKARFGEAAMDSTLEDLAYPESATDVLIYGAEHRLVRLKDIVRLQGGSVENANRAQYTDPGDASRIARELFALYTQRLAEERRALLNETRATVRYQG